MQLSTLRRPAGEVAQSTQFGFHCVEKCLSREFVERRTQAIDRPAGTVGHMSREDNRRHCLELDGLDRWIVLERELPKGNHDRELTCPDFH